MRGRHGVLMLWLFSGHPDSADIYHSTQDPGSSQMPPSQLALPIRVRTPCAYPFVAWKRIETICEVEEVNIVRHGGVLKLANSHKIC
jgi:hypothetical protein